MHNDDLPTPKRFLHYWPFVRGLHHWPVDSLHKGPIIQTFEHSSGRWSETPWRSWNITIGVCCSVDVLFFFFLFLKTKPSILSALLFARWESNASWFIMHSIVDEINPLDNITKQIIILPLVCRHTTKLGRKSAPASLSTITFFSSLKNLCPAKVPTLDPSQLTI